MWFHSLLSRIYLFIYSFIKWIFENSQIFRVSLLLKSSRSTQNMCFHSFFGGWDLLFQNVVVALNILTGGCSSITWHKPTLAIFFFFPSSHGIGFFSTSSPPALIHRCTDFKIISFFFLKYLEVFYH